jgi:hypothetical protein
MIRMTLWTYTKLTDAAPTVEGFTLWMLLRSNLREPGNGPLGGIPAG